MKWLLTWALLLVPPTALMVVAIVTVRLAGAEAWEIAAIVSTAFLIGYTMAGGRQSRRR